MVKRNKEFDEMIDPVELREPEKDGAGGDADSDLEAPENIWMRGLMTIILAVMFRLAEVILAVIAVVQFLWMLIAKEKNPLLMGFGADLGSWMQDAARFMAAITEDKPFPWKKWG